MASPVPGRPAARFGGGASAPSGGSAGTRDKECDVAGAAVRPYAVEPPGRRGGGVAEFGGGDQQDAGSRRGRRAAADPDAQLSGESAEAAAAPW